MQVVIEKLSREKVGSVQQEFQKVCKVCETLNKTSYKLWNCECENWTLL